MTGALPLWSIGLDRHVGPDEVDDDGFVAAETMGRWLAEAVDAYLAQLDTLRRLPAHYRVVRRPGRQPRASLLGRPNDVFITASATEVRTAELTISLQVRPFGGEIDLPMNVTCRVGIEDVDTGAAADFDASLNAEVVAVERAAEYTS